MANEKPHRYGRLLPEKSEGGYTYHRCPANYNMKTRLYTTQGIFKTEYCKYCGYRKPVDM